MITDQLSRPDLDRLWDRVAERLERNGLRPEGVVALSGLSRSERHHLSGLLGRPVTRDGARVDLAALDRRLRAAEGEGLVTVVARLRGPLVDRPGRRAARQERLTAVRNAATAGLRRFGIEDEPWVSEWLEDLRRNGVLGKVASSRGPQVMSNAATALGEIFGRADSSSEMIGRSELATRTAGDAHGLDDGRLLGAIVLRAVALRLGMPAASTAAERRALWRLAGVSTDEVSTTVLTAGLRPSGPNTRWLRDRSDRGWETHLSHRDVSRIDWKRLEGDQAVYMCENPRVLEAALQADSRAAIVCTQGNPTLVVEVLLDRLSDNGRELRYHGDFDWPGIAIAGRILARPGAAPWRFQRSDYEDALTMTGPALEELPPLTGDPVSAHWDPTLTGAMQRAGRAVHEELLLDYLLADLRTCST